MRLALFVPAPFATISGGYRYDQQIVAGLRALGHDVDVNELDGDDARAAAAAWSALDASVLPVIDGLALPAFAALGEALAGRAIGLIHHPLSREDGLAAEDHARLRAIEAALLPRLARVITTSATTAEQLAADFAVPAAALRVVRPGTAPAPRSRGSAGPGCAVLSVGALVPRKGHDVLLHALARLNDLDWTLTIVGSADRDRAHAAMLAALIAELGLASQVRLAGEIGADALETLWQGADLFALATRWEGYGMAIAEALKRGLPVAITAGGAAGADLPAEAASICLPGDHVGLSKALRRMIFDLPLRRMMADAAWHAGAALPDWPEQVRAFAAALA